MISLKNGLFLIKLRDNLKLMLGAMHFSLPRKKKSLFKSLESMVNS